MNMRSKVRALQIKLFHAAKQSLDRKFGALYDKIYREDVLLEAWRRVKANRGAPGIDRQDFEYIEDKIGLEKFLTKIHEDLKVKQYRPKPVLRRWIEKPGKRRNGRWESRSYETVLYKWPQSWCLSRYSNRTFLSVPADFDQSAAHMMPWQR